MASRRQHRVAELIHKEISNILQFNTRDPRIGLATVTEVRVSADLKNATVYVSLLSDDKDVALAALQQATSFFRHELAQKIKLRYTPILRFCLDESFIYGQKIDSLLAEIDIPPETDEPL